ncbi:Molybdenum ABC transporter permease protein ModB [hydrothermal vent metagenome]|uniref:Molybdenum ABC transporter permease protein ModB n=1 Tax=hydrothermal vent metagenome TaxID=652676 RepID=A0A3B0S8Z5_9ZZZZ
MSEQIWQPVWTSLALATSTTLILLLLGVPLAWAITRMRGFWRAVVESLATLPLVLPPTVLGFYLLLLLGPNGPFAPLQLVFSFPGLVVGSVLFSLPFMVRPVQAAFEGIPQNLFEAAACLGAGPVERFFVLALPLAKNGILSGAVLSFAHTLGEFGVVLMVGGNIPDQTRVVSIAIFDAVERADYTQAHVFSIALVLFSWLAMVLVAWLAGVRRVR